MGCTKKYKRFLKKDDSFDKAILDAIKENNLKVKVVFLED